MREITNEMQGNFGSGGAKLVGLNVLFEDCQANLCSRAVRYDVESWAG